MSCAPRQQPSYNFCGHAPCSASRRSMLAGAPPAGLLNLMSAEPLSEEEEEVSVRALHWGFGVLVGGIYGALAEYQPIVTGRLGADFGLALCGMTHISALPMMGLTESPENQTVREHVSELATHTVYGVTTAWVRR